MPKSSLTAQEVLSCIGEVFTYLFFFVMYGLMISLGTAGILAAVFVAVGLDPDAFLQNHFWLPLVLGGLAGADIAWTCREPEILRKVQLKPA